MAKVETIQLDPLPPFRSVDDAISAALDSLNPPARITVQEAAKRRCIEANNQWIPWRDDVAPYMNEPGNLVTSRAFDGIAFVGPARCSKSEGLVINPLVHAVLAQPRTVAVFSPTRDAAREWSVGMVDPLITYSPELKSRIRRDLTFEKTFAGGARLTIDWPVRTKLAQRSIPLVIFTDFDAMDMDVGGDGSPWNTGRKRTQSAQSRAMTIAESSPRFAILDESWTPKTPHEAPPTEGIFAIYNSGTRGRLYWRCVDCSGEYEPRFEHLSYPDEGTPADRGAAAVMVCPHCGSIAAQSARRDMNLSARWLHEAEDGTLVPITDGVRNTTVASYHLAGPAAALASWPQIVTRYLEAEQVFEDTGDEKPIKAVVNIELGMAYLPRSRGNSAALSEAGLRDAATDHAWKTAPKGTVFVLVSVDVQPGRFVVQAEAYLRDMERVMIDRFDVHTPPKTSPRPDDRRIDPGRYGEDWDALFALVDLAYPVATESYALQPLAVVVDSGGEAGVTPNAYAFWRKARKTFPRRFHILKGRGGEHMKRAEVRIPDSAQKGKKYIAKDVRILWVGTDRLKDEIAASLLRDADGSRALHIPRLAPKEVFAEYASERRTEKGWEKKPGVKRNEALDLSVYSLALAIVLGAEKINWDNPPIWARSDRSNSFAIDLDAKDAEAVAEPEKPKAKGWVIKRPGRKR